MGRRVSRLCSKRPEGAVVGDEVTQSGFTYQSNSWQQAGTFVHSLWAWGADSLST